MLKSKYLISIILLLLSLSIVAIGYSQSTKIRGNIIDIETSEPLPFVNVSFMGLTIGTSTDFNGNYFLETRNPGDTLIISSVGYSTIKIPIRKNSFQTHNIKLKPSTISINEIEILAGENPAHILIDSIIANKKWNNPDNIKSFECEVYTKIEIDANNINEEYKNKKVFNQLQFIFDYIDTSVVTGKSYLPIFISETISNLYVKSNPRDRVEIIKASKISGVQSESVSQLTGQMYEEENIYNNYIEIFDQPFVSPIAGFGKMYYKYYLIDTLVIDNHLCYNISFKPKRKQEFTFSGDFWIADTSFAIVKSKIRMANDANLNYINDMVSQQKFIFIDSSWFLSHSKLIIDFNITDKSTGFFGRKTTSYKNVLINNISNPEIFKSKIDIVVKENAYDKGNLYWENARHEELTDKEDSIYSMIDSIKNVPIFRTFADVLTTFVTGYYVKNKFEYGPYYTFYSFNEIEGHRLRLGGRTSNDFSKKVMYFGHVAYGFRDTKIKYSLGFMYMFGKNPRESLKLFYKDDVEQLGKSQNAFLEDNILSTLLQRNPIYKLSRVKTYEIAYEKEWFHGFSNTLKLSHKTIFPTDSIPLIYSTQELTKKYNKLITSEIHLNTRFAYKEMYVYGEFERTHITSDYPIINLDMTFGIKDFLDSDYDYIKLGFNIQHLFDIGNYGYLKYNFDAGKIFGTVPYPLLRLHEGNETYAFDDYAFNMMNYYEFASDEYLSLYTEYHFMGLFLNKAPFLRELKLREVAHAKIIMGSIRKDNLNFINFPGALSELNTPYIETGLGIENIFKILRIDALWRLTHNDRANIRNFGIRAKLQIAL